MASALLQREKVACINSGNSPIPLEKINSSYLSIDLETAGTFFQNWYANLGLIVALVITANGFVLSYSTELSNGFSLLHSP